MSDLVFIGDVHLEPGDPELERFVSFLDRLSETTGRIVFMGDLFTLWIGRRDLEQSHHRAVVEKLAALRKRGIFIRYIEGNRDYRIADGYAGTALDEAGDLGFVERAGGASLFAIHGDLVNTRDRQYRAWRRISRSSLVWGGLKLFPPTLVRNWAARLERRMRGTNLAYKQSFPEDQVRSYASAAMEAGHQAVVLGHFHLERDIETRPPSPPGRILVLPDWKSSHRHLRVTGRGEISFVDSES